MHCIKTLKFSLTAGVCMEESKLNPAIFSVEETDPSLLLLHLILHNSSSNHVCTRGRASLVGDLLCACMYVTS